MDSIAAPWDGETDKPVSELHQEHRGYLAAPWVWRDVVRRSRGFTKGEKYILMALSDDARKTGMGARPGHATLAAVAEAPLTDVEDALRKARRLGFLFVAKPGTRGAKPGDPGSAAEYWLILHPELFERVEVASPAAIKSKAIEINERENARSARKYEARKAKNSAVSPPPSGGVKPSTDIADSGTITELSPPLSGGVKPESPPLSGGGKPESPPLRGGDYSIETATGTAPPTDDTGFFANVTPPGRRCEHGFIDTTHHRCVFCVRGLPGRYNNPHPETHEYQSKGAGDADPAREP